MVAIGAYACGGGPTAPSSTPPPATFTGTVTNTVTGAPVVGFSAVMNGSRVTLSAPGYLTRETTNAATVDLIPDAAPFDLTFYRQFARDALDAGSPGPLRVLSAAPSIYLQRTGLSDANVNALEAAARSVIPALTGGRFQLVAWTTGETLPADRSGVITLELVNDTNQPCGRTLQGASAGHSWLNVAARCSYNGFSIDPPLFAHEMGHALGFAHVSGAAHLMGPRPTFADRPSIAPSDTERYHAAIAYHRSAGNRDVDSD
jgi:hypothetical protein